MEYAIGAVGAVIVLLFIASIAGIDTIKTATERGFYTYEGQLYVVRPASPEEVR